MLTRRDLLALSAAAAIPETLPGLAWALADDADPTRVFTGDQKPTDARLGPPKTLNDYFPFVVPKTKEAWEARRKQLREQMLVATGLWPMPEKTPLNAVIHGKIDKGDYTVEKVFFASMPGRSSENTVIRTSKREASSLCQVTSIRLSGSYRSFSRLGQRSLWTVTPRPRVM